MKKTWVSIIILLATAIIIGLVVRQNNQVNSLSRPYLSKQPLVESHSSSGVFEFNETEYDFGVIKQSGGIVQHKFPFIYNGEETVSVTGVPTSCQCTSAEIDRQELKQGDISTITVSFDPNLHVEPEGKFFKTISLLTDPAIEGAPELKIWVEIDLDLGSEAYKLKTHDD